MREREAPSTEPLIDRSGEAPWGYADNHPIAVSRFARDALQCADNLPDHPWLINVCSDRYLFGVVFFAALLRGRVNLLPSHRSSDALGALRRAYPDSAIVDDETAAVADSSTRLADPPADLPPYRHGPACRDRLHLGQHRHPEPAPEDLGPAQRLPHHPLAPSDPSTGRRRDFCRRSHDGVDGSVLAPVRA